MTRIQHSIGRDGTMGPYLTTLFEHERGAYCDICRLRFWLLVLSGSVFGICTGTVLRMFL